MVAGLISMDRALPLQSVSRECGGPIEVRLSGEVFEIGTTGELLRLVRGLIDDARGARRALWMRRAMAGWVFYQLRGVGPLATSELVARQFSMNANTVRAWMRLALAVVDEKTGLIDEDRVRAGLAERDRERSRRAVTGRQRAAAERNAGKPIELRTQAEVERAMGTRTEDEHRVTRVTESLVFGPQMDFEDLYDVALGVRAGLVDVDAERVAGWLRDGEMVVSRRVAGELGLDLGGLGLDGGLDGGLGHTDEQQRAAAGGPPGHSVGES